MDPGDRVSDQKYPTKTADDNNVTRFKILNDTLYYFDGMTYRICTPRALMEKNHMRVSRSIRTSRNGEKHTKSYVNLSMRRGSPKSRDIRLARVSLAKGTSCQLRRLRPCKSPFHQENHEQSYPYIFLDR